MTNKTKEIQALIQMSRALGVAVDPDLERQLKQLQEEKALGLAKQILEKKKQHVEKPSRQPEEIILEEVLVEPPKPEEPEVDLVKEAYEILKQKTRLNEQVSLETRVKGIENFLRNAPFGSQGSGEVRFKNLDDVDRYSVGNTDHVLRYDPESKMFFFDYLSGDQGKVNSLTFEESGPEIAPVPGMLTWNVHEDCLDVYQADGSTCQVGLETYIEVFNNTAQMIPHGTVVRFSGVHGFNGWVKPSCDLFVADANANPEYIIGVLTNNVEPQNIGRATNLGKVRQLNTTGSQVSEVWQIGDILYAHPTLPGQLTKNKPTAPSVVAVIATVLKVSDTGGVLLVRPNIAPRLYYGNWHDETDQTAALPNTAYAVKLNSTDPSSGFHLDPQDNTKIVAEHSGLFNFEFSLQVTSANSATSSVWVWYRKNGVDVPRSATHLTISANGGKLAPSWNFVVSMLPEDYFQLMWATNSTNVSLAADPATAFCPSIPSALVSVTQVNQ